MDYTRQIGRIGEAKMSESLVTTIETNAYLVRQLEAKQKRIDHLEFVLEQRGRETKRQYNPEQNDEMKEKVYKIFLAKHEMCDFLTEPCSFCEVD